MLRDRARILSWDTETHLIRPGCVTPRPVVLSWAERVARAAPTAGLVLRADMPQWLERVGFFREDVLHIGANLAFDLAVLAAEWPRLLRPIFGLFDRGQVCDLQLRQKMIDVARGERKYRRERGQVRPSQYSLQALARYHLDRHLEKEDTWRLRYGELDGVPLADWPEEAKEYSLNDALTPLEIYDAQALVLSSPTSIWARRKLEPLNDEPLQAWALWWAHLSSCHGLRTDAALVAELEAELDADHSRLATTLVAEALMRANGTQDMKATRARVTAWYTAAGRPVPHTDPSAKFPEGQVATAKEHLAATDDPGLLALADLSDVDYVRVNWLKHLKAGATAPLNPRYDTFLETGRTSAQNPPIQTPAKKGRVRQAFIPRAGYLFADADYDTLELRTLAQTLEEMVGWSAMADALRSGRDLHLAVAAQVLGIPEAEAVRRHAAGDKTVDDARQLSKVANFGFPGGMVPATFVEYAAGFGRRVSIVEAEALWDTWKRSWPEMAKYFAMVKASIGYEGVGVVVHPQSLRVRGDVRYCAACNSRFQGRAADGAKEAGKRITIECYLGDRTDGKPGVSPLYGSRIAVFMHDEFLLEVPEERAAAAAQRLSEVMIEGMSVYVPNIPIKAGPVLMRRWYKGAKAVRVDGVLVPSKPGEGGKWLADL